MKCFNLFNLYVPEEDIGPRSHISCTGNGLYPIIDRVLADMSKYGCNVYSVAKSIASRLNYHPDTVLKMLRRRNKMVSLAVLMELSNEWKINGNRSKYELDILLSEFNVNIEFLGCGSSYRTEIRAVKTMNMYLAKILGAHHADGNLFKEKTEGGTYYKFSIIDGYKSNLLSFRDWFYKVFGIKLKIRKAECNAWIISVKNKIFGRYLEIFFGYPAGNKSEIGIPEVIKDMNDEYKKAYLLGFLTFDGSVEMDRKVSCGVKSEILRDDLCQLLEPHLNFSKKAVNGIYHFTTKTLYKKELKYWMHYFEESTDKWFKLSDFAFGFTCKVKNIEQASIILDKIYLNNRNSSISFSEAISLFSEKKILKRFEIADYFEISNSSMYKYLYLMEMCKIIRKKKIARCHFWEYNSNIKEWLLPARPQITD